FQLPTTGGVKKLAPIIPGAARDNGLVRARPRRPVQKSSGGVVFAVLALVLLLVLAGLGGGAWWAFHVGLLQWKTEVAATAEVKPDRNDGPKAEIVGKPKVEVVEQPKVEIVGQPKVEIVGKPRVEVIGEPKVEVKFGPGDEK